MLIAIDQYYRGRSAGRGLDPGEHEVSDELGEYLLRTFCTPPFNARRVEKKEERFEVKPSYPSETKPVMPAATKPKPLRRVAPKKV